MSKKDCYQVLGIDKHASQKEVRQAYRKLAFQYHPDKNSDNPAASEKMKEINEAYAILSDPAKRQEYDALGQQYGDLAYDHFRQTHSSEDIFRGSDINQILNEFARVFGFRSADDILGQFYGPGYRTFEFRRPGLFGRGFVFYQAHSPQDRAKDQSTYGTQEQVTHFPFSGVLGALVKHSLRKSLGIRFPERGKDLVDAITLNPDQVGKDSEVEYLHKKADKPKKLMVKIHPGIKDGQRIRLRGMGAPGKDGGEPGDMYLEINIKTPLLKRIKSIFK